MKGAAQFVANKNQICSTLKYKFLLSLTNFYLKLNKPVYVLLVT